MKTNILAFILLISCALSSWSATTVSVYTWRDQEGPLWDIISQRNLIPGIKIDHRVIRYEKHETYQPHVLIELLHRKADVFQWGPGAANLKRLIDEGFIAPNQADISDMNKSALLASLGPDGNYYGVPFALQLQSLLVNNKILNDLGIHQQPETLSEFNSALEKIKQSGVTPIHYAAASGWLINQVVAEVMISGLVDKNFAANLTKGTACFTDREYYQIFETILDWKRKGFINENWESEGYSGMGSAIAIGNSAMSFDGGWKTGPSSILWQVDPDFQVGFWSVPGKSGQVYALGDGTYQVNHKSPRAKAAYRVLQYTATKEFAELFAEHVKELPAYGGKLNIANPMLNKMSSLVSNAYPISLFGSYALNKQEPSYNELVLTAFTDVLKQNKTPKEAAQTIQDELNKWKYIGYKNCQ